MSRKCTFTGKGVLSGNNVSHSNRKTRRRFLPNLQNFSFFSLTLDRSVTLRLAAHTARTIDHNKGLDEFLLGSRVALLQKEALLVKKEIMDARKSIEKATGKITEQSA